jgi:NDP-sugar pyrophosphorylase family protein
MSNCYAIEDLIPVVDPTAYVHPTAVLIGEVIIGPRCHVGPAACLRGDFGRITLQDGANVQDTCVIHGFPETDTIIETDGHIGHGAVIHGAHIGPNVLVRMNASNGSFQNRRILHYRSDVLLARRHDHSAAITRFRHSGARGSGADRRGNRLEEARHA